MTPLREVARPSNRYPGFFRIAKICHIVPDERRCRPAARGYYRNASCKILTWTARTRRKCLYGDGLDAYLDSAKGNIPRTARAVHSDHPDRPGFLDEER